MITEKRIVENLRVWLPEALELLNKAHIEVNKQAPNLEKLNEIFGDAVEPFCNATDTLSAYNRMESRLS